MKSLLIPVVIQTNSENIDIKALEAMLGKYFEGVNVKIPFPFQQKGNITVQHEFDHKPTYITDFDKPEDRNSVFLGPDIPTEIRIPLAEIIQGILNANSAQLQTQG